MDNEQFNNLFEKYEYEQIIRLIRDTSTDHLDQNKLALAYFHTEHYKEATAIFQKIALESNNAVDWFNFSTSSIYNRQELIAIQALEKALEYNTETRTDGEGIPPAYMLFISAQNFYNIGNYATSLSILQRLAKYYISIDVTDNEYLYNHGIPMYDDYLLWESKIMDKQA